MKQSIIIFFLASLFVISCGDSVDCDANSFANDVNPEIDELNATGAIYAQDPTEDNCKEFKKAAENYLEAVEKYGDCTELDQTTYQQQLQSAQDAVSSVSCN